MITLANHSNTASVVNAAMNVDLLNNVSLLSLIHHDIMVPIMMHCDIVTIRAIQCTCHHISCLNNKLFWIDKFLVDHVMYNNHAICAQEWINLYIYNHAIDQSVYLITQIMSHHIVQLPITSAMIIKIKDCFPLTVLISMDIYHDRTMNATLMEFKCYSTTRIFLVYHHFECRPMTQSEATSILYYLFLHFPTQSYTVHKSLN